LTRQRPDSNSEEILGESDQMADPKLPRKLATKAKKPQPRGQNVADQAAGFIMGGSQALSRSSSRS
jgi:hypothetical protein